MKTQEYINLLDALPDGVVYLNDQTIHWANAAFWKLVDIKPDSAPSLAPLSDYIHPASQECLLTRINAHDALGEIFEISLLSASQESLPVQAHLRATKSPTGTARMIYIRHLESDFETSNNSEQQKQRAAHTERLRSLGEMAAGVAHDFNNTLTTILGRLASIRNKLKEKEPIERELSIIEAAAQSATDLIMRIREFSRPAQQGRSWQNVDLRLLLEEACLFIETRVPKTVSLVKNLQPVPVIGANRSELLEVFLNLLTNALDAVESIGKIEVSCTHADDQIIVSIQDDGIGIDNDKQEQIFEPFFSTKEDTGTGLGLSVSRWILRRHDAPIKVISSPGQGTEFKITFQVKAPQAPHRRLTKSQLKVVVVDDDVNVAEMVKDLLEEEGHQVELVTEYERMVNFSCTTQPDLVITDLDLAGTSGWDLAREVALIYPETVIGLMTGWPLDSSEQELRVRGIDFILNKPFTLHSLHQALEKVGYQVPTD